jgi:hypothetical protein
MKRYKIIPQREVATENMAQTSEDLEPVYVLAKNENEALVKAMASYHEKYIAEVLERLRGLEIKAIEELSFYSQHTVFDGTRYQWVKFSDAEVVEDN